VIHLGPQISPRRACSWPGDVPAGKRITGIAFWCARSACRGRGALQEYQLAAFNSITSSARPRIDCWIWDSKPHSLSLSETIVVDGPIVGGDDGDIKLTVRRAASKALARIPRWEREALLDNAEAFAAAPFAAHPAATPLRGRSDVIRLRQRDWRGICRVDRTADTIVLETVARRSEVYR
jgi:mRNA-degrading endonuclease RelE of RelBE toxin-antitoxin system